MNMIEDNAISTLEVSPEGVIQQAPYKAKVMRITIRRTEGQPSTVDEPRAEGGYIEQTINSFAEADSLIRQMATTAPEEGARYDKADFLVMWDSGHVYEGRFDMRRHDTIYRNHLQRQIKGFLRYLAGEYRPADMTLEEYAEVVASRPEEQKQALDMLDTLDLS
jgi:hypothetical protein